MTGQYPRRRESDTQAERRVAGLTRRRRRWLKKARRLTLEEWLIVRPRISGSGRLVRGLA